MKKAVFIIGNLCRYAKRGTTILAEDFDLLTEVADFADVDAEIVFAVQDLAAAGRPKKATMKMIRAERQRMLDEIAAHAPDFIMAFGPIALKALADKGNLKLSDHLRQEFEFPEVCAPVYVSHSLDKVAAMPGMAKWLRLDTKAANDGWRETEWGDYDILDPSDKSWYTCPAAFVSLSPGDVVGFDLETYPGLDPWHKEARIRMAVISNKLHKATIVQLGPDSVMPLWLSNIVTNPDIIKAGSNIKFDHKWLQRFGVRMVNMHDTSTAEHVVDETNPMKDLKSLAFLYAPWLGDYSKGHRTLVTERGGWEFVADDEMYQYTGGDGEASYAAAMVQQKKLADKKLTGPFQLSMDLYAALAEVEHSCCIVDMDVNAELDTAFQLETATLRTKITEALGPINPGSPQQLAAALLGAVPTLDLSKYNLARVFDPRWENSDEEEISTDRATLEREASKHPIIETVLVWRRLNKLHSTYVKGIREKYLIDRRGKAVVSTSFRTDITETYRLSSQAPNLQNIPRKPRAGDKHAIPLELNVKRQYVSRFPGGRFMEVDLAQAELRVAAMLSQDPLMCEAILSGEDIHTSMASMLLGKPRDGITWEERQRCKTLTFLILYGGGANTLSKQLGIHKEEAKTLIREYFATFKKLDFYITQVKSRVKRDLYVESIFGYRRRFQRPAHWNSWPGWRIERMAWNMMVQNPAACIAFIGMIDLQREFEKRKFNSKIVLQVHDSIGIDVDTPELHPIAELAKQCMENPNTKRYGVELTLPFVADVEVGLSWGDKRPYNFGGMK